MEGPPPAAIMPWPGWDATPWSPYGRRYLEASRLPLPPQEVETCAECQGHEKVLPLNLRIPGRVNRWCDEKTRLCEPCRKGTKKGRYRKAA